jgi:hypothetical protein
MAFASMMFVVRKTSGSEEACAVSEKSLVGLNEGVSSVTAASKVPVSDLIIVESSKFV